MVQSLICGLNGLVVCSTYRSLQAYSEVKFAAWPTSWQPLGADRLSLRWPEWILARVFADDDSTINIVLVIIIIIIINIIRFITDILPRWTSWEQWVCRTVCSKRFQRSTVDGPPLRWQTEVQPRNRNRTPPDSRCSSWSLSLAFSNICIVTIIARSSGFNSRDSVHE